MITDMPDIHLTVSHTGPAVIAAALVHLDTDQAEAVKETVDRSERTQKPAESPVTEDTGQPYDQQDHVFPGEQDTQLCEHRKIAYYRNSKIYLSIALSTKNSGHIRKCDHREDKRRHGQDRVHNEVFTN